MESTEEISMPSGLNENVSIRVETVLETEVTVDDGNGEEDEGFQGNVTPRRASAATLKTRNQKQSDGGQSIRSNSNSTESSWASKDDLRRHKKKERGGKWSSIKSNHQQKDNSNTGFSPPRLRRPKTPTTNNLSTGLFSGSSESIDGEDLTASILPPSIILNGEVGDGRGAVHARQNKTQFNRQFQPPQQHTPNQQQQSSFRKWMAEGMLETLNVVAGITLSTTGTILSPPIALTRAIIPSLLAVIVDALDAATPRRVQDWFRILSSSVYHLFVVLVAGSTERGKRFKSQITQVAHSFVEAWSAPESRQVVVDGMATGVKLADALHTPEMKIFLDQLGILSCRLGDAMASGKSKEFLLNFKDLIWTSIELASDSSTTLALAEVTAHLCHALKEVDEAFNHATPRSVRNTHNEKAYLNSTLMTKDYPFESMEKIILSSLGIDGNDDREANNANESIDDFVNGFDDGISTEQSIPSNVAFRVVGETENPFEIPILESINEKEIDESNWEQYKERVDVDLLQRKIVGEGRKRSRSSKNIGESPDSNILDYSNIEEEMEELQLPRKPQNPAYDIDNRNPANTKDLYEKFERTETKEVEKPSDVQFLAALDELMGTKQMEKNERMREIAMVEETDGIDHRGNPHVVSRHRRAKVRVLRKGVEREEKMGSKVVRERYSNLRRLWKQPPFVKFGAIGVFFLWIFWVGFGVYGMYTLFRQVVYFDSGIGGHQVQHNSFRSLQQQQLLQQSQHAHTFDSRNRFGLPEASSYDNKKYDERMSNYRPNEIVIRIVKEVVHVREDGSRIENYEKMRDDDLFVKEKTTDEVASGDGLNSARKSYKDRSTVSGTSAPLAENDSNSQLDDEEIEKIQKCVVSTMDEIGYEASDETRTYEESRVKECLTASFQE